MFEEYEYYGEWQQPLLSASFWSNWYDEILVKNYSLNKLRDFVLMKNGHTFVSHHDLKLLRQFLEKKIKEKNIEYFRTIKKITEDIVNKHELLITDLEKTNFASYDLLKKFLLSAKTVMVPWLIGVVFTDDFGKIISEKYLDSAKILSNIGEIRTPIFNEHLSALEIKKDLEKNNLLQSLINSYEETLKKIKEKKDLFLKINNHVKEYSWLGFHHFWGETLTIEKFLKNLLRVEEFKKHNDKLTEEELFYSEVAGILAYIRQISAEIFAKVSFKAKNLLTLIARGKNLVYEELIYLGLEELLNIEKITLNSEDIKKRKDFLIYKENNQEKFIFGEKANKIEEQIVPKYNVQNVFELKGVIANSGYAKGKAKIFLIPENIEKFEDGDVLVTPMTTPDFMPLIKKASAIVTDVGGLLSHPAIISRELGIPCILDTKNATSIFNDGELLEVDANRGIVKRIVK